MKTFAITLALLAANAPVHALPGQDFLLRRMKALAPSMKDTPAPQPQCANFSGDWKGSCTVNGQVTPLSMKVEQLDCSAIKWGHDTLVMGSLNSETQSLPPVVSLATVISSFWSPKADVAQIEGSIYAQMATGQAPVRGALSGAMSLNGAQLAQDFKVDIKVDSTRTESVEIHCSYDRQ